jgi:hypothetical protein
MFAYVPSIRKYVGCRALAIGIGLMLLGVDAKGQLDQTPPRNNVDEIVRRSSLQTKRYSEEFKNLLAKETKTVRTFDKKENVKKERVIVSNFLVYQFLKGTGEITEFRSVLSVDGKVVSDVEKRAIELFERVSKSSTTASELERIQKESLRYDDEIQISGLTLFQGIALDERVRDSFLFEIVGREMLAGTEAWKVQYRQIKDTDLIRISDKPGGPAVLEYDFDLGDLKHVSPRLRGTLWIDAKNYQILREVRELAIKPDGFEAPVVIASNAFEYSPGEFGIYTPRRIVHSQFRVDPKIQRGVKEVEYLFEYSDFTRPKVEVTSDKPAQP